MSRATALSPSDPSMTAQTAATSIVIAETVSSSVPRGSPKCSASVSACDIARNAQARIMATSQSVQPTLLGAAGAPAGDQWASTSAPVARPSGTAPSAN